MFRLHKKIQLTNLRTTISTILVRLNPVQMDPVVLEDEEQKKKRKIFHVRSVLTRADVPVQTCFVAVNDLLSEYAPL